MKRKLFLSLLAVVAVQLIIYGQVSAQKNSLITEQIINECKAVPVEYGLTAILQGDDDYNSLCREVFSKTGLLDKSEINSQGGIYSIKAEAKGISMEAQLVENRLEIQITGKDISDYTKFKEELFNVLSNSNSRPQYYQYTKCSLKGKGIDETYEKVVSLAVFKGVKNLNTINIDNGYSITGYTGSQERIRIMGRYIDMSIAIVGYKSGNYIIIGTPEIMAAY